MRQGGVVIMQVLVNVMCWRVARMTGFRKVLVGFSLSNR